MRKLAALVGPTWRDCRRGVPPGRLVSIVAGVLMAASAGCGEERAEPSPPRSATGQAGPPSAIDLPGLSVAPRFASGERLMAQSGCLACHRLGAAGNDGPGPDLSEIGSSLIASEIARLVVKGPGIMPNYEALEHEKPKEFHGMVAFLDSLDGPR